MGREFDESGQFKTTTTLQDILDSFDEIGDPFVSTGEIAEASGCGRETARQKLTKLHEQDKITRKKVGQSLIWSRVSPEETAGRPDRRLRQLSREMDEEIVVNGNLYKDGETHLLSDAQTAAIERTVAEVTSDE